MLFRSNSYQIVESYIKTVEIPFCVIHLSDSNKGPSKARNKGIESSTGDFIAFLDADDSWTKDKLHKQMKIFSENPHIDLLGCNINIISSSTKKSVKHSFSNKKLSHITFRKLLYKHYFTPSAIIVKRDVIFSCGMFKEDQRFMEDSLLFSKIARNYNSFISCEFLLNTYKKQYGDKGLSANLNQMQYHEMKNFLLLRSE